MVLVCFLDRLRWLDSLLSWSLWPGGRTGGVARHGVRAARALHCASHSRSASARQRVRAHVRASFAVVVSGLCFRNVDWVCLRWSHLWTMDPRGILGGRVSGQHRAALVSDAAFPLWLLHFRLPGLRRPPCVGMRLLRPRRASLPTFQDLHRVFRGGLPVANGHLVHRVVLRGADDMPARGQPCRCAPRRAIVQRAPQASPRERESSLLTT